MIAEKLVPKELIVDHPTVQIVLSDGGFLREIVRAIVWWIRSWLPDSAASRRSDQLPRYDETFVPTQIGKWTVIDVIGHGTCSTVYRVVPEGEPWSTDYYALKLHSRRNASEPIWRERFKREIKVLAGFRHRNVVQLYDTGTYAGRQYLVMEMVEGKNLREIFENWRLPVSRLLDISIQIARGLQATHGRGILHRDLKPENILTTKAGIVKLADFGLAREASVGSITQPGLVVGTPAYLSPETLLGREPDERSDLYSLGVILYELFTGAMPYRARSVAQFIDAHLDVPPIPPSLVASLPRDLEKLLLRLLEKNPKHRVQNATELLAALEAIQQQVARGNSTSAWQAA